LNHQTEKFLQLYKELEYEGRRVYFPSAKENESIIGRLLCVPQLKAYKDDLDYCRVVRNFLTHNPKVGGVYPIVPSQEMINLLRHCVNVIVNPPLAIDYAIPIKKMFTVKIDSCIMETVKIMNKFTYTHVPVYDEEKLIGVFSENTVYSYMCCKNDIHISENTTLREFIDYLPIDKHINEYFSFIPKKMLLHEAEELFKHNFENNKLLAAVYITENGRSNEPILGMLTHWDILLSEYN